MPIYEYQCKKCGHRFERIQKFSDPEVKSCPECKGKVEKVLSAPAVQFKGTGWYVTDYARKSSGGPKSGGKGDGESSEKGEKKDGGSDSSKATEGKPEKGPGKESKSESKSKSSSDKS